MSQKAECKLSQESINQQPKKEKYQMSATQASKTSLSSALQNAQSEETQTQPPNPLPNPPLIPTSGIFKNGPRKWSSGSIFKVPFENPQVLNLMTLRDTVWTHPTQEMGKDQLLLTGHEYLKLLLPSYEKEGRSQLRGSSTFKTYNVDPKDPIRNHYNLDVLEWLIDNKRFLPEEFLKWVISNNYSLCAWAGATRGVDGRIRVPQLDLESREINWFYLGEYVTSRKVALSSCAYAPPRATVRFY